jgi:phosphoglycerate dehydrogenase-like enzyme
MLDLHARHEWGDRWLMSQIAESTVAVVGLGGIGRMTAERLAALGAHVIGVHRRQVDAPGVARTVSIAEFPVVAATVDAIVISLPETPATYHLLGREILQRVKPGVTIVNVGRGSTVDEIALVEALHDGRVGLAVLDVTEREPLPPEDPLWDAPNLLISPHTAAVRRSEERLMAEHFAANATRLLDGEPLVGLVDMKEFY